MFVLTLILAAITLTACTDSDSGPGNASREVAEDNGEPLNVVVTMPFMTSMVEAVGEDSVAVDSIVPTGSDAHSYQPSPGDAQLIADADLIFVNGMGLEAFLEGLIESAGGVDAPVVELSEGLHEDAIEDEDHHHNDDNHDDHHEDDHDHDHPDGNPHLWLDPAHGIHYVDRITEALGDFDPASQSDYRGNADVYMTEIEEFDTWAQDEMAGIPEENRLLITFHDAFPYFAAHYDLEIVGVVVASPGREPGAQEIARLADEISALNVRAVFIEPQFNPAVAEAIADEAGVEVFMIYSDTPPEDAGYLEMMELNVENIVEGLS